MLQLTFGEQIVYHSLIYTLALVEFLPPLFLLSRGFKRRSDYYLKLFLVLLIILVKTFFLGVGVALVRKFAPGALIAAKIFATLLLHGFVLEYLWLIYKEKLLKLVLCAVIVFALQRLTYELYMFFLLAIKGTTLNMLGPVGISSVDCVIHVSFYLAVELAYCFAFGSKNDGGEVDAKQVMTLASIFIIGTVVLRGLLSDEMVSGSLVLEVVCRGFDALCNALILFLHYEMLRFRGAQTDYALLRHLWTQKGEQFELSQRTVDLINTKCHDIRHQLDDFGTVVSDSGTVEELKQSIQVYDGLAKTGNDVLDVILAEKFLYCQSHGIRLHYIVDGSCLSFMSAGDIYAIFGNGINNAVEYLGGLEKEADRVFRMFVKRREGFISGHLENPLRGELRLKNGLPVTGKDDGSYHGYGLLSMQTAVKKLGGSITVSGKDGLFTINFLIPIP